MNRVWARGHARVGWVRPAGETVCITFWCRPL